MKKTATITGMLAFLILVCGLVWAGSAAARDTEKTIAKQALQTVDQTQAAVANDGMCQSLDDTVPVINFDPGAFLAWPQVSDAMWIRHMKCMESLWAKYLELVWKCGWTFRGQRDYREECVLGHINPVMGCFFACQSGKESCSDSDDLNPSLWSGVYERSDTHDAIIEFKPKNTESGTYKMCDWSKDSGQFLGIYYKDYLELDYQGKAYMYNIIPVPGEPDSFSLEVSGVGAGRYTKVTYAYSCTQPF